MTASAPVQPITTFSVSLYRDNPWYIGDDFIGKVSFPRNGTKTTAWTNVGSGDYYFYFTKANDGATVSSSNVHMHN